MTDVFLQIMQDGLVTFSLTNARASCYRSLYIVCHTRLLAHSTMVQHTFLTECSRVAVTLLINATNKKQIGKHSS